MSKDKRNRAGKSKKRRYKVIFRGNGMPGVRGSVLSEATDADLPGKRIFNMGGRRPRFTLNKLEDLRKLNFLMAKVAGKETSEAHDYAVNNFDKVLLYRNGKLIRKDKKGTFEVVETINQREVQKGTEITLRIRQSQI